MSLEGFTPPYTPTGRSALVPPPPWHYAAWMLSVGFGVDPVSAQALLPDGFGTATGQAYAHFCDWQSTTDGTELLDPVYAQYKECILLVEAERRGVGLAVYCPMIYVDQDISMIRGLLQGWPKKMGSVWLTRSIAGLAHPAAAPLVAGSRVGASLAAKDRRLAEAAVTLTGHPGEPIGFLARPSFGLVGQPSIIGEPSRGEPALVRPSITGRIDGPSYAATVDRFAVFPGWNDELGLLVPVSLGTASVCTVGITVVGALQVLA